MAVWRYEISLLVFQHSKRNFVSPRGHVISSIHVMSEIYANIKFLGANMMQKSANYEKNPRQKWQIPHLPPNLQSFVN